MDWRCGETMSFKTVQKPHMKKREVRVIKAPVCVCGRKFGLVLFVDEHLHGAVFGAGNVEAFCFVVVADCFRTLHGDKFLSQRVFVRGILMEDEDFAVSGGEVDEFGAWVEGIGVHAFADWGSEDYLAG